MWAGRVGVGLVGIAMLSGCAGGRTRQDVTRLQSQVNLLDERVGQLERSGTSGAPATSWNESASSSTASDLATPTGTTPAAVHAKAKHGHRGSTRDIQQALKNAGFYQGSVDGKMGPKTKDAIKEFQHVHGLKEDGVVGRQTWAKLSVYLDSSAAGPMKGATGVNDAAPAAPTTNMK